MQREPRFRGAVLVGAVWAVLFSVAAVPALGQRVDGRLVEAGSERPISGALVQLRAPAGGPSVAETMSGDDGSFRLETESSGRYRLHVERIGFRGWRSDPFTLSKGAAVSRVFRVSVQPVDLGTLEVEAETRCRVRPAEGRRAARLWNEVRTALQLTDVGQREGLLEFRVRAWQRELDPEGETIREERSRTRTANTLRPFMALSSDLLTEEGFVSGDDPGRRQFYAPSARTLVSDAFLDTHCLEFVPGEQAEGSARVGLRFRPAPGRDAPDVRGTLWVDRETAELRELEYRYVNVEPEAVEDRIGGRLRFRRLPSGTWFVEEWRIRTPKLARQKVRLFDESDIRIRLVGLTETGRRVVSVRREGGELVYDAERATLSGIVYDSTRARPLSGAVVRLAGTERADTTDAGGRYRIPGVGRGTYRVYPEHARYGSLGVALDTTVVRLRPGRVVERTFAVPSWRSVLASLCAQSGGGTLVGVARDSASRRLRTGTVRLVDSTSDSAQAIAVRSLDRGPGGGFWFCGVQPGRRVELRAVAFGRTVGRRSLETPAGNDTARVDLRVRRPKTATLFGAVVRHGSSEPVDGVRVVLGAGTLRQVSDSAGTFRFRTVPPGEHRIDVRHVAYRDWTDTVRLAPGDTAALRLQVAKRVVELEPVEVDVDRPERARFFGEASRTYALEGDELDEARRRSTGVAELLRALEAPGLTVREERIEEDPPGPVEAPIRKRTVCVEVSRQSGRGAGCSMVDVYIDDVRVSNPARRLRAMDESVIGRVEFIPASQAGARYGTGSGLGVLVIETRNRGRD